MRNFILSLSYTLCVLLSPLTVLRDINNTPQKFYKNNTLTLFRRVQLLTIADYSILKNVSQNLQK